MNCANLDAAALRAQAEIFERMAATCARRPRWLNSRSSPPLSARSPMGAGKRGLDLLAALDPVAALAFFDQLYGRIVALAVQIDMRR